MIALARDRQIEEKDRNRVREQEEERKHTQRALGAGTLGSRLSFTPIATGRDDYLSGGAVESLVQSSMSSGYRPTFLNGPYAAPKPPRQLDEQPSLGVESLINRYVGRVRGYG